MLMTSELLEAVVIQYNRGRIQWKTQWAGNAIDQDFDTRIYAEHILISPFYQLNETQESKSRPFYSFTVLCRHGLIK